MQASRLPARRACRWLMGCRGSSGFRLQGADHAEVSAEQGIVLQGHAAAAVEVRSWVEAVIASALPEGEPQDGVIAQSHGIRVVHVSCPERAEVDGWIAAGAQGHVARLA